MTTTTSPTERVGRYQLLEPIGIGPSGAVSRAKVFGVAGFERQFAVKRFHPELTATAAMAAMLSAAARAYGSLEHPRIARMSEFGVAQGSTFTAVEYVLGLDALRLVGEARLAGVTLPAGGALALVSQAARAVGYAHGRGLTHLGLAPTNVIVTAEGDIKITDFGILSATLPQRPIELARLAQRIPYLAPEQLANEATSAATDVFALGVLAYELVTGNRTFKGETPQQIASAIMAGPPAEPMLPRPIVRVLQRCLARSPFERFPDARALADALDAALRVAPVPGTRKDIGAQVKDTLDRLAALNEGQMSGMVALHLGTGPVRRPEDDDARRDDAPGISPYDLGPADAAPPTPATTLPDLQRPPMTVPGVPPPPIPVPPGVGGLPGASPPSQAGAPTLLGVGRSPPALPAMRPMPVSRPGTPSASPARPPAVPAAALRPGRAATDLSIPIEVVPPEASTESAIHPLDPGDLMPIDGPGEPALEGAPSDAGEPLSPMPPRAASPALATTRGASSADEPDEPDEPAEPAEPDEPDDLAGPAEPPAGTGPAAGAPETASSRIARVAALADAPSPPQDPHRTDTRPFAQVGPPLFDPIVRSMELPVLFNVPSATDEGAATERGSATSAEPASEVDEPASPAPVPTPAPAPVPAPAPAPVPAPAMIAPTASSGPIAANRTMLGFAAPMPSQRAATPSPAPAEPSVENGRHDELSGMALEEFRAVPPGAPTLIAPQALPPWRDGADHGTDEPPPHPAHLAPPSPPLSPQPQQPPYPAQPIPVLAMPPGMMPMPAQMDAPPMAPPIPAQMDAPPMQPPMDAPPMQQQMDAPPMPGWPAPQPGPPSAMSNAPPRRRVLWIAIGMIGAVVVGIGGWQIYARTTAPSDPTAGIRVTKTQRDAGTADGSGSAAVATVTIDAAEPAATASDATAVATTHNTPQPATPQPATPQPATPQPATPQPTSPQPTSPQPTSPQPTSPQPTSPQPTSPPGSTSGSADALSIASTPPGARVFLDGSDHGATPVTLPGSPDRHNLALLLAGHELYLAQVDGHGTFQVQLKEVTPSNGPAGIKVLRCKDKDRYYVFVDGKPSGQTCPTERIGCEVGPHTVEVYDAISETRRKWDFEVKDTRLSFRIRVE